MSRSANSYFCESTYLSPLKPFSHILVVDDEPTIRKVVTMVLSARGYKVETACDGEQGLEKIKELENPLVLCDLKMPHKDGLEFLRSAKKPVRTILVSAFATSEMALEAIKLGAEDYISKPFSTDELIFCINKAEEKEKLRQENENLKRELREGPIDAIFVSDSMKKLYEQIKQVAQFDATILIQGESGVGKELVARAIHKNSNRAFKNFLPINCGAISEQLVESELFGHVAGSFTNATENRNGLFREADGGTLFLDEVGELSQAVQTKLLRALQENRVRPVGSPEEIEVDTRILVASLKDLSEEVEKGSFREDLFYRLNVITLRVPPLRNRKEDIRPLAEHFLQKVAAEMKFEIPYLTEEVENVLTSYDWPGNVRELQNAITRAAVLSGGGTDLDVSHFPESVMRGEVFQTDTLSIKENCKLVEQNLIKKALEKTNGNRTKACKLLDISHRTLLYKIKEYEIS